jgi:HEAT repeat protein
MSDDKPRPFDALNPRGLAGKREYVRSLEQRRDEEALSLLVECLCDESSYLRDLAEESLLRLGEKAAPILVPLLEQGLWYTRASVARVLGRCAYRPAVPAMMRLTRDANETVDEAAWVALIAIGRGGGAIAIARSIHELGAEERRGPLDQMRSRDRQLADRVERMMRQDDLMTADGELSDESPMVRASEEGLEWEILTSPSPSDPRPPRTEGTRAGPTDA